MAFHFYVNIKQLKNALMLKLKWGASSQWPFGPSSAWGSIKTAIIMRTHSSLFCTT